MHITSKDVLSSALYPKVFQEWQDFRFQFGDKITQLPTRAFLAPLDEDEEISVEMAKASQVTIKFKAKGELQVPSLPASTFPPPPACMPVHHPHASTSPHPHVCPGRCPSAVKPGTVGR